MSYFRKTVGNRRGQLAQGLALVTIISGIVAGLTSMVVYLSSITKKKIIATRATLQNASAIETAIMAFRAAEMKYFDAVQGCDSARPFLEALKSGAGCDAVVTVFDPDAPDIGVMDGLYQFVQGGSCRITAAASSCATGAHELLQVPLLDDARSLATAPSTYHFLVTNLFPERQLAEMSAVVDTGDTRTKFAFAIRASLANSAHLEPDGRVTQQAPDPLSYCQGQKQWADFLIYNPLQRKCLRFAQLGSGTGLAYYRNRYFGFRPSDGQVIDLIAAQDSSNTSYLVDESGNVASLPPPGGDSLPTTTHVFPPYAKAPLVNVDDITVIGDQVYYVAGSGADAHIGVLVADSGTFRRFPLCPAGQRLGDRGWSQAYEGIAALASSTPLVPVTNDPIQMRFATFYLKTSGGDLLTAVVRGGPQGAPYTCVYFKDRNLQQVEYKRTNGFDRTDTAKPYLLY